MSVSRCLAFKVHLWLRQPTHGLGANQKGLGISWDAQSKLPLLENRLVGVFFVFCWCCLFILFVSFREKLSFWDVLSCWAFLFGKVFPEFFFPGLS